MEDLGASTSTVSSDASPAPAPDTAAASAPPAADASAQAPAAQQGTETAASTETGAPAAPASLDDIFNDFKSKSAQETATPEAPEPEAPAPKAETDEEEQPDDAASDEPEAPAPKADDDPLADEAGIPTRDEINEAHKRAPKAIRDLAADLAERAAEAEGKLAKLGGDEGAQVAEAIIPHLFSAEVTPENADAMFDALVEANAPLVATMGESFINAALNDERTGPAFADRLLEGEFGEGYTAEQIRELVELHREGLIDVEGLRDDIGTGREPTARERDLEAKLEAANKKVTELTGGNEDATRKEARRLEQTVRKSVGEAVMAKVQPLAERIGWVERGGNTGPLAGTLARLGSLAAAEMNAQIEQTPEWDAIQQLVADGNAFRDGEPTRLMRVKLEAIQRRAEAMFKKTARELRPLISAAAGRPDHTPTPTGRSSSGGDAGEGPSPDAAPKKPRTLEEINADFDRRMREAQSPVGTTRR